MVKLYGIEVPLRDLPQICWCGDWDCPDSYRGNPETTKRLDAAREKLK